MSTVLSTAPRNDLYTSIISWSNLYLVCSSLSVTSYLNPPSFTGKNGSIPSIVFISASISKKFSSVLDCLNSSTLLNSASVTSFLPVLLACSFKSILVE